MTTYKYIQAKSILSRLRKKDDYFGITYNMNLYRGCQHGCIYCDTRSACYGINDISSISVKENAPELLQKELASKKEKATIGTGSMNDPYMPLEKELTLTRRALEKIYLRRFPVHIITKSTLVYRDYDLLQALSGTYAAVSFTITAFKDSLSRKIEPNAPSTSERFRTMKLLAEKGIYTGITMMPLLPFINDTEENIRSLLLKAKESGAGYVIPMIGVTLRNGSREYFYNALDESFPGIKGKYMVRFGDKYECFSKNYKSLYKLVYEYCKELNLPTRMTFYQTDIHTQLSLF
ncbi:MAG: radical SAM protein [Candidatus Azobacteroides sp.]|nr:radical SAM protein [Candidatus Azobacteroides sp.]